VNKLLFFICSYITVKLNNNLFNNMEFNFKKFEHVKQRQEKRITVTKSNSIGFPTQFYVDNKIKDYKYVELFWDADKNAIGVYFTNDESEENKFRIIHSEKYGGHILARSFFRGENIDPKVYRGRYNYEITDIPGKGKAYAITLKENNK
jgi:hypothetical protein